MLQKLLLIGCGGFLGCILRYTVSHFFVKFGGGFPYGTLIVNTAGCLVIGFVMGLNISKGILTENTLLFFVTGLLGGFTTFSAFSYETLCFLKADAYFMAALNVTLNIILGLVGAFGGFFIAKLF